MRSHRPPHFAQCILKLIIGIIPKDHIVDVAPVLRVSKWFPLGPRVVASALSRSLPSSPGSRLFALANNPVSSGLVASLARRGGNVTGLSVPRTGIVGKRLELLREVTPRLGRLAIMANVGFPDAVLEMGEVEEAAKTLGLELAILKIQRAEDIAPSFEGLKSRADALYVCADPLAIANRVSINSLALGARLPMMYSYREFVSAEGLVSYGANVPDMFRRAADYVDKILRGAKPSDIPVEQPTKFDLVINLTTAKVLGLTVPPMLLS